MQKKYRVITNMKDDNGYHNPGDLVLMDDNQAGPLLAIGCIEPTVEDITPHVDTMTATPATRPDPASSHNMTSQQTGEPMTAAPSGAQVGPDQPLPPATTNPETQPAADQPGADESIPAAPQTTPTNNPTPEQINADMAQLG